MSLASRGRRAAVCTNSLIWSKSHGHDRAPCSTRSGTATSSARQGEGTYLLYIDLHLIHEVTTPQAFEGLKLAGRKVRRPDATIAVADHNVPTSNRAAGIDEPESRLQVDTLERNVVEFGVPYFPIDSINQGIVHIIGPEQGLSQPGMTIVCGDSHTATHGAFGALAFGIGTSEVEHVLATQTLIQAHAKNMLVEVNGALGAGVSAKDVILAIIGKIGTAGGTGHVIEYAGSTFRAHVDGRPHDGLQHDDRGGRPRRPRRAGRDHLRLRQGPAYAPKGAAWEQARGLLADAALRPGRALRQEGLARRRRRSRRTSPGAPTRSRPRRSPAGCPTRREIDDPMQRAAMERALQYMRLKPNTPLVEIPVQRVFIGSCTNSRIEDLRAAAAIAKGRRVAEGVRAMIVPGSGLVKHQAEEEGLDRIFLEAGFEWREPGCSNCMSMNNDRAEHGERIASTSNRNFEGRQGKAPRPI